MSKNNKVMEAPKRIYIHPDIGGREFLRPWLHRPVNNESIEYTLTDAFIEKAISYIQQHWIWNTNMIEGFKNYMKGKRRR